VRTPHLRGPDWFARAATIAAVGHVFFAATFVVRRLFHAADISGAAVTRVEEWMYAPAWALFGAGVFWLGTRRGDAVRRWIGLGILVATIVYVFALSLTRLSGFVQVGSMIGVALVGFAVNWFARANRDRAPLGSIDLLGVKPGARRDRRHGRRQRSS
jgi:uncharacterized membrane protein